MTEAPSQSRNFSEKFFTLALFIVVTTWMIISWFLTRIHTQVTIFQAEVIQEQDVIRKIIHDGKQSLEGVEAALKVRHTQKRQNVEDSMELIRREMKKNEEAFFNEINQEWRIDVALRE